MAGTPKWAAIRLADCERAEAHRVLALTLATLNADDDGIDVSLWPYEREVVVTAMIAFARMYPYRDSDGNPKGGDGTAPSQSDDSAARRDRPQSQSVPPLEPPHNTRKG